MNKFSDVSKKVNQSVRFKYKNSLWILAAIITVLFVLILGHKEKNKRQLSQYKVKLTKASLALQKNLKRIKSLDANQAIALGAVPIDNQVNNQSTDIKYLERLSMPSTVYEAIPKRMPPIISQEGSGFMSDGVTNADYAEKPVEATKILHADFTIPAGEMLHAVLGVAINSDLPGMLSAIIGQPVYALTGKRALIPKGSRLIGQYSSALLHGQNRIYIIWNRIILPDGISVTIDSSGTDAIGRSGGGADAVNRHFFQRFSQATLLSILGATVANYDVSSTDQYNSASQYRSAIVDSLQDSANASLENDAMLKPTLMAYQGKKINVFLAQDLSFYGVLHDE